VIEIGLLPRGESRKDLRENRFPFADHRDIRQPASEEERVLDGDFRTADNDLHLVEILPDLSQEVKSALNVPQVESAADDLRPPIEDLFDKMPVIKSFLFRL
jgi:hypothetical protein